MLIDKEPPLSVRLMRNRGMSEADLLYALHNELARACKASRALSTLPSAVHVQTMGEHRYGVLDGAEYVRSALGLGANERERAWVASYGTELRAYIATRGSPERGLYQPDELKSRGSLVVAMRLD